MLTPLHDSRTYSCPDEPGAISRSVHLARLATSYTKCRQCPHRHDAGAAPVPLATAADSRARLGPKELIRRPHGFRGVYLNQLDRHAAITWAAALAVELWDDFTGWNQSSATLSENVLPRDTDASAPVVVIGYDERPASPDLLTGFVLGLQRMSCQVVDIGLTTAPCLSFAVHHLSADAGVHVTGAGCDPAWTGFDLQLRHGIAAESRFLDRWQETQQRPVSRPSRSPGGSCAFSVETLYEANLWSRFHALRPLCVVCGATSPLLISRLERVFSRLPGRLHAIRLPVRQRRLDDSTDADAQRLGQAVREHAAHLGLIIDDDAAACGFLDEQGRILSATAINRLLVQHLLQEHGGGTIVLGDQAENQLTSLVASHHGRTIPVADADLAACLTASGGLLAVGNDHRLWFGGDVPSCDAIVTLAHVMQALSRSDADFSQVISAIQ